LSEIPLIETNGDDRLDLVALMALQQKVERTSQRNRERFEDFMFQLTQAETEVVAKCDHLKT
jgi:hypothetical protein